MKLRLAGIFCLSLSLMLFELTLIRAYSATLFYHFAFMAISVAMLGLAAAGLTVHRVGHCFRADNQAVWAGLWTVFFAVSVPAVVWLVFRIPVNAYLPPNQIGGKLTAIYLLSALPFYFAGLTISGLFAARYREIGKLYAWDLVGAGLGALAIIPLLNWAGGESAAFFISILGFVAAALFCRGFRRRIAVGLAFLMLALGVTNDRFGWLEIIYSKGQKLAGLDIRYNKWNSISRILAIPFRPGTDAAYTWCPSPNYPLPTMEHLSLMIDDGAASPVLPFDGRNLSPIQYLLFDLTALPHRLRGGGETLIIGCGGGRDVLTGLLAGAKRIDAVDINPLVFDAMNGALSSFNGHLYSHPQVTPVVAEGRAYARRHKGEYDLVQIAMIDTWAATSAGAYALSENSLYTVEAFVDYIHALKPDGMFSFTRFFFTPPRQALRLVSLFLAAAERTGIEQPDRCILVAKYESLATLIFKKEPFKPEEILNFRRDLSELGFDLVYSPDQRPNPFFKNLIESNNRLDFYERYPFDVTPSTDERPFFFNILKMRDFLRVFEIKEGQKFNYYATYTLLVLLFISVVSTVVVLLLPIAIWGERSARFQGRWALLTYFVCIGLAYIMIETALLQRFVLLLGNPLYSAGIVVAAMLASSGLGSLYWGRLGPANRAKSLRTAFYIIVIGLTLHILTGSKLIHYLLPYSIVIKIIAVGMLLLPLGWAMGFLLPAGITAAGARGPGTVAWCWAVNGAASVVAAPLSVALSMSRGFNATLIWAALCYITAFALQYFIISRRIQSTSAVEVG